MFLPALFREAGASMKAAAHVMTCVCHGCDEETTQPVAVALCRVRPVP